MQIANRFSFNLGNEQASKIEATGQDLAKYKQNMKKFMGEVEKEIATLMKKHQMEITQLRIENAKLKS